MARFIDPRPPVVLGEQKPNVVVTTGLVCDVCWGKGKRLDLTSVKTPWQHCDHCDGTGSKS